MNDSQQLTDDVRCESSTLSQESPNLTATSGEEHPTADNQLTPSKRRLNLEEALVDIRDRKRLAKSAPQSPDAPSQSVPGYTPLYSLHLKDDSQTGQIYREIKLEARPNASTFKSLSSITPMDATTGYDPVSGLRRIQHSQPSMSTAPITGAIVRDLARRNMENDELRLLSSAGERGVSESLILKEHPHNTIGKNKAPNPLTQGRLGSWLQNRVAINTPPSKRTPRQSNQYKWYSGGRDAIKGVKMPYGLDECLFDTLTSWENNPGSIPASIRCDPNNTLLAEDICIHSAVRHICTGAISGNWSTRAKHVRLFLLALFRNGEHLWLQMPANGITSPPSYQSLPLLDRIRESGFFTGSVRGEEHLIRFAVHLQVQIWLKPWDVRVFGRWATRVMSGLVYNAGARSVRATEPVPNIPAVAYRNGTPFLDMPRVVERKSPDKGESTPLEPGTKNTQFHQCFDPEPNVKEPSHEDWTNIGPLHYEKHRKYDVE